MNSPRDLLRFPLCRPEDLGAPMPDLPHANSVCLPTWQDVIDYEEKRPRVIDKLKAGYPRFVIPPACRTLFLEAKREVCAEGEDCHLYRAEQAALRCAHQVGRWSGSAVKVKPWRGVFAVVFPLEATTWALKYWRHTGEGLSSRQAQALLEGESEPPSDAAERIIRERIARALGVRESDVRLFSCGMSAIYTLFRVVQRMAPGRRIVQFGFPYVDTLKIIQDFGSPHLFLPRADATDVAQLAEECQGEAPAALFCEFPSNPVLISTDLEALRRIADRHRFPIIIDDTIAMWTNVDLLRTADVLVTSLTKWFTGRGDVMLGSLVINPASAFAPLLRELLEEEADDVIWGGSVVVAEDLSRDADQRIRKSSESALRLADWLRNHPAVETVYYPAFQDRDRFDRFRRPNEGFGGLFSFVLRDPARTSARFYNAVELCKGPNLGTTFTLCCPFTLLAHYDELDWAEACGVSRWLLRISVGQEEPADLIDRLDRALAVATG